MTYRQNISISILGRIVSLMLLLTGSCGVVAQKVIVIEEDTIPFFRGVQVSGDLFGAGQMLLNDYGQYEGALRINLRDKWFPIVEIGYGKADYFDEVTNIYYKTAAPYYRIGCDINLLKNKHADNRLYGGIRYAFTNYKVDLERRDLPDPVWKWESGFRIDQASCSQHWFELVVGVDAKIFGPLHLGWSVRYKRRLFHDDGDIGQTWYIPGYGIYGDTRLGGTFNVIIDI